MGVWYDYLENRRRWSQLWRGHIFCGCGGIMHFSDTCSACGRALPPAEDTFITLPDGRELSAQPTYMGAEGRYEDWVLLNMLAGEWLRPVTDDDRFLDVPEQSRPSPKAMVILVFWTYFETRIDRILREPLRRSIPSQELDALMARYLSVGSRMDRAYRRLYHSTYFSDLERLGYSDTAKLLDDVQLHRNAFSHGHPEAISDALVQRLVEHLKTEHESWVAVYNLRVKEGTPLRAD